jgi:hypothetical protein
MYSVPFRDHQSRSLANMPQLRSITRQTPLTRWWEDQKPGNVAVTERFQNPKYSATGNDFSSTHRQIAADKIRKFDLKYPFEDGYDDDRRRTEFLKKHRFNDRSGSQSNCSPEPNSPRSALSGPVPTMLFNPALIHLVVKAANSRNNDIQMQVGRVSVGHRGASGSSTPQSFALRNNTLVGTSGRKALVLSSSHSRRTMHESSENETNSRSSRSESSLGERSKNATPDEQNDLRSIMEAAQKALVIYFKEEVLRYTDSCWTTKYASDPQDGPDTRPPPSSKRQADPPSVSKAKNKRLKKNDNAADESHGDGNEDFPDRPNTTTESRDAADRDGKWACPFQKKDPDIYCSPDWHTCQNSFFPNISRVK